MIKIRKGLFETNSSSTHALCIFSKEQWRDFRNGKLAYDIDKRKLVPFLDMAVLYADVSLDRKKKWGRDMSKQDFVCRRYLYANEDSEFYNYNCEELVEEMDDVVAVSWYMSE